MPFVQCLGGWSRRIALILRPAKFTHWAPDEQDLHSESLSLKTKRRNMKGKSPFSELALSRSAGWVPALNSLNNGGKQTTEHVVMHTHLNPWTWRPGQGDLKSRPPRAKARCCSRQRQASLLRETERKGTWLLPEFLSCHYPNIQHTHYLHRIRSSVQPQNVT